MTSALLGFLHNPPPIVPLTPRFVNVLYYTPWLLFTVGFFISLTYNLQ